MATLNDYLLDRAFGDTGQWHDSIVRAGHLIRPDTDVWPERCFGNTSGPFYSTELDTLTLIVYGLAHRLLKQPSDVDMADIQHWFWDSLEPVRGGSRPVATALRPAKPGSLMWDVVAARGVRHLNAEQHVIEAITAAIGSLLADAGYDVPAAPVNGWNVSEGPVTTMWLSLLRFSPDEPIHELGAFDADPDPALWMGIPAVLRLAGFTAAGNRVTS